MYNSGDIVLINFPFTNLIGSKIRPVLDSYIYYCENLSLTLMVPLTPPSPLRGEGKGEGKISNMFG
jgi:hypothetical protein